LLGLIEDDRVAEPALQRGVLCGQLSDALLQPCCFLTLLGALHLLGDTVGLAINPLPGQARCVRVAANVAVLATKNDECTGNPLLRGYHAHG